MALLLFASPALRPATLAPVADRLGSPVAVYTFGNAEQRRAAREGHGTYDMQDGYGPQGRYATHGQAQHDRAGPLDRYDGYHGMRRGYGMMQGRHTPYGIRGGHDTSQMSQRMNDIQSPYGIRGRPSPYDGYGFGREQPGSLGMQGLYGGRRMRNGPHMQRGHYADMFERDPPGGYDTHMMQRMHDMHGRPGLFSDYGMQVVNRYGNVARRGHLELD